MADEGAQLIEGQQPTIYTLYIQGGGMKGIIPLTVLARLEELTGQSPVDLFQVMEGSSVGAFLVAGMNIRDPDDPDKAKYTMKDGLQLFVETTPQIFPDKGLRTLKMATDQVFDGLAEASEEINTDIEEWANTDVIDNPDGDTLTSGFNGLATGAKWLAGGIPYASLELFQWIRPDWEPEEYMFEQKDIRNVYESVLGKDTKLSDCRNVIHMPVYDAMTKKINFLSCRNGVSSHDITMADAAVAASANNFIVELFAREDVVHRNEDGTTYTKDVAWLDPAMVHIPTGHNIEANRITGEMPPMKLVEMTVNSRGSYFSDEWYHEADTGASAAFNWAADTINGDLQNLEGLSPKEVQDEYYKAGGIWGAFEGGLKDFQNHINQVHDMNKNSPLGPDDRIMIGPVKSQTDEPSFLQAQDASPETIDQILDYAGQTIQTQNDAITNLAYELVENIHLMGRITDQEYEDIKTRIDQSPLEKSTLPQFLKEISPLQEKPTTPQIEVAPATPS
ncbi:MAG: hypothetical protein DHS20C02_01580 [Micavibrio sp.]|nr:MAG: hypothetical protein DHS20C02_01580 [Micavibrio sp.]